jgi:hypothetical protein
MAENVWPSWGENVWPSLGENPWPIIARKMTQAKELRAEPSSQEYRRNEPEGQKQDVHSER